MRRRDLLKAIGIGGILPFVGNKEVEAAPQVVQPQPQPTTYTMGSASWHGFRNNAITGIGGTVSFSLDGINWQQLGEMSSWELTDGDE